ncbi:hypothetical protein F5141DRAFT_113075 [Pisolithus sp. B1]|nr:hypothetical protein F5141DRAFT_113075 [Pisolithus sp. B1]
MCVLQAKANLIYSFAIGCLSLRSAVWSAGSTRNPGINIPYHWICIHDRLAAMAQASSHPHHPGVPVTAAQSHTSHLPTTVHVDDLADLPPRSILCPCGTKFDFMLHKP